MVEPRLFELFYRRYFMFLSWDPGSGSGWGALWVMRGLLWEYLWSI